MLKQSNYLASLLASVAFAALTTLPALAQDAAATDPAATETPATEMPAPTAETVVATVNGVDITLGQMIITRSQLPQQYQSLPDDVLFAGILDQLIQQQTLAGTLATDPKRVTIAVENQRRSLLAGEVVNSVVEGAVTDEAVQAAYDATYTGVEPVTEYNASHILVATEEEAIAVKARIDAGEDFAAVATEMSTDSSAANGGNLGWFGPGMMVAPFEAGVVALEPGAVSAPVQTDFGWHVIKLNETRIKPAPALEEVRADLVAQVQEAAIQARLAEITATATITRPEDGAFDPAVINNLDLLRD
jgi:peptidyl-prolyl cis-trans isomerase C